MFPHLPAPIKLFHNYIIFFLQLFLSFHSSSNNPFSPISPLIPSAQVSLGLPRFLLPGGRYNSFKYNHVRFSQNRSYMSQDMVIYRGLINTTMSVPVLQTAENFFSTSTAADCYRTTIQYNVST
jgi:hypothetical protein